MREDVHFITVKAADFEAAIEEAQHVMSEDSGVSGARRYMLTVVSQDNEVRLLKSAGYLRAAELAPELTIQNLNAMLQVWLDQDPVGYFAHFLDKTAGDLTRPVENKKYLESLRPCSLRCLANYLKEAAEIKAFRKSYGDAEADVLYQDFNSCVFHEYGLTNAADRLECEKRNRQDSNMKRYVVVIQVLSLYYHLP